MTLNDLLRKAQALAMQFSSGDVPLDKDIDFEIATQDVWDNPKYAVDPNAPDRQ